jgi:uncharacterized protein (DUF488 family)
MELYTIGYEGLNEKSFLAWLKRYKITVVADVRHLPASRKRGFSKSALNERLNREGISYMSIRELGASKCLRNELYKTGDYNSFFKRFRKNVVRKRDELCIINNLIDMGERVVLLCFERDPQKCHRKIVAEEVKKIDGNGLIINHLSPTPPNK